MQLLADLLGIIINAIKLIMHTRTRRIVTVPTKQLATNKNNLSDLMVINRYLSLSLLSLAYIAIYAVTPAGHVIRLD